jgi:hypothetical protein
MSSGCGIPSVLSTYVKGLKDNRTDLQDYSITKPIVRFRYVKVLE